MPLWEAGRETALLWSIAAAAWGIALVMSRRRRDGERTRAAPGARARRARSLGLALLAGALSALSFPEPNLWWLAWIGLVPAMLLVASAPTSHAAALRGWFGGVGYLLAATHWLTPKIGPGIVAGAFLLGLTWMPWGALTHRALRGSLYPRRLALWMPVVASAWLVTESLRSWDRLGGPWGLLGASQWRGSPLLSLASFGGVWLIGSVLVAINLGVARVLRPEGERRARIVTVLATLSVVAGAIAAGTATGDPTTQGSVTIGGVQPGPGLGAVDRFEREIDLTQELANVQLDLVVWGESSVGIGLQPDRSTIDRLAALSSEVGAPLLVNIDARRGEGGIYKSSVLLDAHGARGSYDKMRLVPFGEYIPLRFALEWLESISEAAEEDWRRGEGLELLGANGYSIGPLVCFESAFPDMTRNLAARGADLIVVQSATTTFQESWAPEQHASLAAVRAVEVGRPVVHATLSGVSAIYGPSGRLLVQLPTSKRGIYVAEVPLTSGRTLYVRWGDWVLIVSWLLLGVTTIARRLEGMRYQRRPF